MGYFIFYIRLKIFYNWLYFIKKAAHYSHLIIFLSKRSSYLKKRKKAIILIKDAPLIIKQSSGLKQVSDK